MAKSPRRAQFRTLLLRNRFNSFWKDRLNSHPAKNAALALVA